MKKKIIVIVLFAIISGICAGFIIETNKKYGSVSITEYNVNEIVENGEYSVTVDGYGIFEEEEFAQEYNITQSTDLLELTDGRADNVYVMVVDVTFDITGDMKGFPYADINVTTGAVCQGISSEYITLINEDNAIKEIEKESKKEIKIPFLIHSISFPYTVTKDSLKDMTWDIYFSVTPARYVRLGE